MIINNSNLMVRKHATDESGIRPQHPPPISTHIG